MSAPSRGGVNLTALARAFGGDVYAGGRRAVVPAPGHSAQDRSASLWLRDGRVIVKSFGRADWREVLDALRADGWIDADNRLLDGGGSARSVVLQPAEERSRADRTEAARRLWAAAVPIPFGSPAARHLARRGVDLGRMTLDALRAMSAAPASVYRNRGPYRPALLAKVCDPDGDLTAVEITYLRADGRRCTAARPPRKMIGVLPAGSAVRLSRSAAAMTAGEGVCTTLSAMRRFDRPGWALLSTSNLRAWTPPPDVEDLLIAADRGRDGERSAKVLCARAQGLGVRAAITLPPKGYGDWNDLDREE